MKNVNIKNNKIYFYITEFFVGMSVMAAELGASRLLAPYFSSSQIVWTIVIGTIMIALALGNLWGGIKADKGISLSKLYFRILIVAIWLALIPVLGKYIIVYISKILVVQVNEFFLIIATFIAVAIIFVFPTFLLGSVTPSIVKFSVSDLSENGTVVGKLYACNTIGCILGTFIPTFISIPAFGTSATFFIFSGILLIICYFYFINVILRSNNKQKKFKKILVVILSLIIYIVCMLFNNSNSYAFWLDDIVYEGESSYNYLMVREDKSSKSFLTNIFFGVQSMINKNSNLTGGYYDYALASLYMADVYNKDDIDILVLGNGTGTFPTLCQRFFDQKKINIDAVELDSEISEIGYEYFDMSDNINVVNYDGRAYLNVVNKKYDIIMVDAYQDFTYPFQMSTIEFFSLVKRHLTNDGVMVANVITVPDNPDNVNQYIPDTIASVFSNVWTLQASSMNCEVFASANYDIIDLYKNNVNKENNTELIKLNSKITDSINRYSASNYVFTDDKAPVELMCMKSIGKHFKAYVRL